jgi:hypothetical protein
MVVKFVVFVINLKPSNIFSLIVIMLVFSGVRFIGVFGIAPPTNVSHLFGDGRNWVTTNTIFFVLTGASALCWAIWLTRNDFVSNKNQKQILLQVLFWGHFGSDSGLNYNGWIRLPLWRHTCF